MNNRKWPFGRSALRHKVILSVLLMTLPLIGMLLYNNFYAIHVVRGQVADSYNNLLTLYMNQIDTGLNDADAYMNTVGGSGSDLTSLGLSSTDTEYYSAKFYLFNLLSKDILLYDSIDTFFVYEPKQNDFMIVPKSSISIEEIDRNQKYIVDSIQNRLHSNGKTPIGWQHHKIAQDDYLIEMVQYGNVYLGAWVKTDRLLTPLNSLQIGESGEVLLSNSEGEPIAGTDIAKDRGIELKRSLHDYYLSGNKEKFLVVGTPSQRGNFSLVVFIPDQHILAKLPYLQWIIWLITAASLLFVPMGLYAIRQSILVPLNRVLLAMKKVRNGDWSQRVNLPKASEEFKVLGESFNAMMMEIDTLRVNVYEEQLNKQREELQRLQLQLNPHFFLNSLNIVYNLAKVKNYDLIMQMTMALIQYFRFLFRSNTSFVKLKDELEHTRNYLSIQMLRFPDRLSWCIDAPDYLSDIPIPPLVIQTFVENSIKHAMTMEKTIHIAASIQYADEESGSYLKIRIQDTGQGFDDEVLCELQAGRSVENDLGERTGIWNVQRRLKLLYAEPISIHLKNDKESGGAVVEMIIPTMEKTGEAR
ncbi:sensor histidine kinase [Paenibacillus sinopodophylli]|uniref:sensor histidine kinase n=1 Tax=Paenibacillus sinopodophylli TaxID=1837342 RepID=UPI001485C811|nr:histidine kinase [Paenibacillus sinopodophylli]